MSHPAALAAVETYTAGGMHGGGGPVVRIRVPSPNDVLAGRGGCINAHVGNRQFREWVRQRKDAYNSLAASKSRKLCIVEEIIALVTCRGGRFLQRDTNSGGGGTTCSSSSWWIELDRDKVLSKTSQALREGATRIKAERIRKQQQGLSATATTGVDADHPEGTAARSTAICAEQAIFTAARQFQEPNQSTTPVVLPQSVLLESQQSAMKQLCSWLREEVEEEGNDGSVAPAAETRTTTTTKSFPGHSTERHYYRSGAPPTAEDKREEAQIEGSSSFACGPPHNTTTGTNQPVPPLLLPEEESSPRFFCRFPSSSNGGGVLLPAHDRSQSLLQVERMLKDLDCKDTDNSNNNAPEFVNPFEHEATIG